MDSRILNGRIFDDGSFGGTQIGRISNGRIYEGTWMGGNEIGKITSSGEIIIDGKIVGRINDDNEICEGTWMGGTPIGKISSNGVIKCGFWMGGKYAGRIEFDNLREYTTTDKDTAYKNTYYSSNEELDPPLVKLLKIPVIALFGIPAVVIGYRWGSSWYGLSGLLGPFIGPVICLMIATLPVTIVMKIIVAIAEKK